MSFDFSIERLQIEEVQQNNEMDPKMEEQPPLAIPPPNHQEQGESSQGLLKEWKFISNHPQDQIIGNPSIG